MSLINSSIWRQQAQRPPVQPMLRPDRLTLHYLRPTPTAQVNVEGSDVVAGLTARPKALPPKYFYDDRGSDLFEQITDLPEYYLTRVETSILKAYADDIARLVGPCELVELGSGSSTKTRYLLTALEQTGEPLRYLPVDVSGGMLEATAQQLLGEYPSLTVHGLVGVYDAALAQLPPLTRPTRLIAFIGSTLGNLSPAECQVLLGQISAALNPGDYFLLGVDLAKDSAILERAYNDSQGVTAAFNLNMLSHLNWRFQGNFQPEQFRHRAIYNPEASQIEIYIDSLQAQTVALQKLDLTVNFTEGEPLRSEISRKFNPASLGKALETVGLPVVKTFTDAKQWFGLMLCQK